MFIPTVQNIKARFTQDELFVLVLVLSVFLTLPVTLAVLAATFVWILVNKRLRLMVWQAPKAKHLAALCCLNMGVSIYYLNFDGLIFGAALTALLTAALFIRRVMSPRLFEAALDLACVLSILSAVIIGVQLLLSSGNLEMRPASTFFNANYYATVTELIVFFCLYKMGQKKNQAKRQYYLMVMVINLAGLFMSGCRTAIVALIAALPIYLLPQRRTRDLMVLVVSGTLLIAVFFQFEAVQVRISDFWPDMLDRAAIWKTAIMGFFDHPILGQGSGAYALASLRHGGPLRAHAHSLYLDPLINYGFVGAALIIVYLRNNIWVIRQLGIRRNQHQVSMMVTGILVASVIHGVTDQTLISIQPGLLLAVVMGAAGLAENQPAFEAVPVRIRKADKPAAAKSFRAVDKQ